MVEVQSKDSSPFSRIPAGNSAKASNGELDSQSKTHYPSKEPQPLICPECGGDRVFCNGAAESKFGVRIQRYVCRECGRRFSDSGDLKSAKQIVDSYLVSVETASLNAKENNNQSGQVCAKLLQENTKNLTLETRLIKSVFRREKNKRKLK